MFFVTLKRSLMLTAVLLVAALAGTVGTSSAAIKTGVYDLFTFSNATQRADSLQKTRAAGSNLAKSLIYWRSVAPHIGQAVAYLNVTASGRQWIANLHNHVFCAEHSSCLMGPTL